MTERAQLKEKKKELSEHTKQAESTICKEAEMPEKLQQL